jgi:hypothetical protein
LATLKFFGIEVSLARVTVSIEQISGALSHQQYFSGYEHLIAQVRAAITKPEIKLIEVNLHTEPYWWSTRLFLLATLADIFSAVERIVIVEGGANRFYVGMISPHVLRESLAARFPELEVTYQQVKSAQVEGLFPADQVDGIVKKWTESSFLVNGVAYIEENRKILVDRQLLLSWLPSELGKLERDFVEWDGGPESTLLNYMLVCRRSAYVPLVRERRLEKVVDRIDLTARVAENALRQQLS